MTLDYEQIKEAGKIIAIAAPLIGFAYKLIKHLIKLNNNVEKVLDHQTGQLSMHKGLHEALNEIKGIKLVCNERHRWDGITNRRNQNEPVGN